MFSFPQKVPSAYKRLNRSVGQALHKYGMIADGDRILVGVSGGSDSLSLLWVLNERRARSPIDYALIPVYVDPGFEGGCASALASFCEGMGQPLIVEKTDYGIIAHSHRNRENPCFLCARLRRKRLFEIAEQHGCRRVALGHNKDDLIETFFLNICYAGEISTMLPSQTFFRGRFTVIRPLAHTDADLIRRFADAVQMPRFPNPCPSAERSKRAEIKSFLQQLYRSNHKTKGNIFHALSHCKPEYLLKP